MKKAYTAAQKRADLSALIEPDASNPGLKNIGMALLLSGAVCAFVPASPAWAADPAVSALLRQAQYWRSKGREDLAQDALRRAKALAPNDPEVRKAANPPKPKATPKPKAETKTQMPSPTFARTPAPAPAAARPAPAPAPVRQSTADRAGTMRVAGYDALDDNDLSKAEGQFQRALSINGHDAAALGGLGLVRLRQSRFAEAADLLEQASRFGKADQWAQGLASARFFAGIADARGLLQQGQLAQAQSEAESLVRSNYQQPAPALELLADIYEAQGRHADAADLYAQAAEGDRAGGADDEKRLKLRAIRSRALAAAERGDDMGAQQEFQSGLVLDPNDPWIRYEFARFMIKRGRVPEAESLLQSLVNTGRPDSLYAAALIDNELGRTADADRLIDRIPESQRTAQMRSFALGVKTDAAIARAKVMGQSGQQGQALAALRQIGAMPALPSGKKAAVAAAMLDLGDSAGAVQVAQSAMNGQVTDIADYEGLMDVFARSGRDDLAQQALQRAGQMVGTSAEGQQAYGRMSARLMVARADRQRQSGQFAQAFDTLQAAWTSAPDDSAVMSALARLYQAGNMPGRAAQTWQLFLQKKPGDRDALLGLAETAQAAGDKNLSEQAERQALRAFPQDYQVYLTLARVEQARGDDGGAVRMLKQARLLYARSAGLGGLSGGNPFSAMQGSGANPFSPGMAPSAPAPVNPFALGSGSRIAAPPAPAYGSAGGWQSTGYGAASGHAGAGNYGDPSVSSASYSNSPATAGYPVPIGAPTAPARDFGAPAYPTQAQQSSPFSDAAMPSPAFGGAPAPVGGAGFSSDPVMAQIQGQIAQLSRDNAPRLEVNTDYRQRSGETGLSQLSEIKGTAKLSAGVLGGRAYARADAMVIDSGRPTGSALARFGRNGTIEAQAIVDKVPSPLVNAQTQNSSGVALAAGFESDTVKAEVGTTPLGMGKTKATFHAEVSPKIGNDVRISAMAERQPVTDSIVSYAGTRDPVTGERWGQVMRTAAGGGLSYDRAGTGAYVQGRYYSFRGENTSNNSGFEANIGGYVRAYKTAKSSLSVGLNVNYQAYDKSQNYFTFGNGGYFSPQRFISVGFPINYALQAGKLDVNASVTPGFQSYAQDETALYPTDAAAQAQLDGLKALDTDVRATYDSLSKTGFALSALGSLYYNITPNTRIGGEASYNTFGTYDEFRSMLGVRQSFGSAK